MDTQSPVVQQCECIGWNLFTRRFTNRDNTEETTKFNGLDTSVHGAMPVDAIDPVKDETTDLVEPIDQKDDTIKSLPDNWEEEYFKKFEWLMKGEDLNEIQTYGKDMKLDKFIKMMEKYTSEDDEEDPQINRTYAEDEFDDYLNQIKQESSFLKQLSVILEPLVNTVTTPTNMISPFTTAEKLDPNDPNKTAMFLYFVSLKQNKMLLHASVKKPEQMILDDCFAIYEYAQIFEPEKIVYTMQIQDLYDVDKYVKIFMNMFGLDDCRGGSYTSLGLSEAEKSIILKEGKTASIDHYVDQENAVSPEL